MKESQTLEFKKSLAERKEILETISAFGTKEGGKILVGIDENKDGSVKEIVGIRIRGKEIENLTNEIKQNTDPVIFPSVKIEKMEGKEVLSVEIEESPIKPVFGGKNAFIRVGRTNRRLSTQEIIRMAKESGGYNFTELVCKEATLEDIDEKKVRWFLRKAKAERNYDVDPETPLKESLERLKLMKDNRLTNAAVLLFGKEPQKFFLQARIRCARFKGVKGLDYIDMKVLDGTIPELREKAMKFIMEHIKHGVYFDANRRYDKWEYPLRALEEVLTNALAHRVYESPAEIQVSIYDDRIEVWNPGELPKPLKPSDLKKKHRSIPRNPLIAEMLFLIRYIEKWGRGTNRVIEELLENKLSEPKFQNLTGGFEVVLTGPGKEFEKEIEKEKLHVLEINERQRKAIDYLKKYKRITKETYQSLNNVSSATAKRDIKEMVNKKIVRQVGKGPTTYYLLNL